MNPRALIIAAHVRKTFERIARDESFPADLACLCLRASKALAKALTKTGIKAKLVMGGYREPYGECGDHCWIEIGDKIIDITATQFGTFDRVHVTDVSDPEYFAAFKSARRIAREISTWDINQRPQREDLAAIGLVR